MDLDNLSALDVIRLIETGAVSVPSYVTAIIEHYQEEIEHMKAIEESYE